MAAAACGDKEGMTTSLELRLVDWRVTFNDTRVISRRERHNLAAEQPIELHLAKRQFTQRLSAAITRSRRQFAET
jgi:hypothetical protein